MNDVVIAENQEQQKIAFIAGDHIGTTILRDGVYDRRGVFYIKKVLQHLPSPIVFDIGANIGNHALAMAAHSEMVYLFEPQPNVIELLNKTMTMNQIKNWHIFNFGLANEKKILPLYKNLDGNNGASTFLPQLRSTHFVTEQLEVRVGDDVIAENNIKRIDFIKIDVEGFEAEVIAGLKNTIQKFSPFIILEWNNENTKTQFKKFNLLNDVFTNYIVKAITYNHHKSRWHKKIFAKARRFIYRVLVKKQIVLTDFVWDYDYQHVLFVPKDKVEILNIL